MLSNKKMECWYVGPRIPSFAYVSSVANVDRAAAKDNGIYYSKEKGTKTYIVIH